MALLICGIPFGIYINRDENSGATMPTQNPRARKQWKQQGRKVKGSGGGRKRARGRKKIIEEIEKIN